MDRITVLLHLIGWEWHKLFGPITEQSKEKKQSKLDYF